MREEDIPNKMVYFLPKLRRLPSLLLLLILVLVITTATANEASSVVNYHGGPLLGGDLNLVIIWYGRFARVQKNTIRSFITSLKDYDGINDLQPQVSSWWHMVESYQSVADSKKGGPINVKVLKQAYDVKYSLGKTLKTDSISSIFRKAIGGEQNVIPVLFTARDVTVQGLCTGNCSYHGLYGKQPTIVVGNPEEQCPGECAWPFHRTDHGPQGMTLEPPNGNMGADAMVISFASSLLDVITNPFSTGFYQGPETKPMEASSACKRIFGSGAFEGYTGKLRVDPSNGGAFNSHGAKGKKFLLPAIWNPKTSSCWTLL